MSKSAPLTRVTGQGQCKHTNGSSELPSLVKSPTYDGYGGMNLRKVTVLSKADWEGIQYRLNKRQIEAEKIRKAQEEKQRLHELSLERAKNWSNTVFGQRQKRLEERQKRLEKEEEERKKIDVEEAMFQAEKRKSAIEKAKLQQYYQTDRVKGFHGALLLTEVLKEREAQIELKKLREQSVCGDNKETQARLREAYEESLRIDHEQKQKARDAKMKTVDFQKAQMRQRERENDQRREEDRIEAAEIRRLAAEFAEEERRKAEMRREMAAKQAADNRRQMEDVELMKQIDRMQEEEEDEECRLFAAAKRKMIKMRMEKERQLRAEKQAELQVIQDKLAAQMHQKVSDEDARIKSAMEEREAAKAAEEAAKEGQRTKMLHSINEHRIEQGKLQAERRAAEKRDEVESLKARLESDKIWAWNELEKVRVKKEEAKALSGVHLDQADERRQKDRRGRAEELEQYRRNRELDDIEEAQFQSYARDVIEHCEQRGRNTYPLRRAAVAAGYRPGPPGSGPVPERADYVVHDETRAPLPSFQTCATDATKLNINGNNANGGSNKRLGFVW